MVRLLDAAGVRYAVMAEERCHAESARRLGDEYMYMTVAEENVTNLANYSFDRILCHCPHCYNTFLNEYPQFGGEYSVVHHSELLAELIEEGRLSAAVGNGGRVAFHDSCYLGRYNDMYEAPRQVLAASGVDVVELPRSHESGFCCGGGGGRMWFEHESQETAVEVIRMEEILGEQPDEVCVACPFCLTMLESGAASMNVDDVKVRDIAEILAQNLD
jgi:Fe-S oxidoreductase